MVNRPLFFYGYIFQLFYCSCNPKALEYILGQFPFLPNEKLLGLKITGITGVKSSTSFEIKTLTILILKFFGFYFFLVSDFIIHLMLNLLLQNHLS